MKNAIINVLEYLSLDTEDFIFVGKNHRNGVSGLKGVYIFNFNRYIQMAFQKHFTFLLAISERTFPSYQPAISLNSLSNFCLGHDCKVKTYCYCNLHFSISDLEYLFVCLLAIWVCSSVNCLFIPFVDFSCGIVSVCQFLRDLCIAWILTSMSSVLKIFFEVFHSLLTCKLLPLVFFR